MRTSRPLGALLCALALSLAYEAPALAQTSLPPAVYDAAGHPVPSAPAAIVNSDGTVCNFKSGGNCSTGGGGTASLQPFAPDTYTPATLAPTTTTSRVAAPGTGATVVVTNSGSVPIYVNVGGSTVTAATTNQIINPGNYFTFYYSAGSAYVAAITSSGTGAMQVLSGSGLPAVGTNTDQGGTVSTNQTQVGGTTLVTGAGATGAGSPRTTVAQDTSTVAGSAPGTAGTPSANVLTVQGPSSGGTPIPTSPSAQAPGSSNMATTQVSVGTTATQIVAARAGRAWETIVNPSATALCVGPTSGVTTTTGLCLPAIAGASMTMPYQGALYGIVAAGTVTVSQSEVY